MSFALDLRAFAEKAAKRADDVVAQTTAAIVREVDQRSPVGNPSLWKHDPPAGYVGGRFRANWQLGVGSLPAGVLDRIDNDGASTVSANIAAIPEDASGRVYYLANNLPYAMRLEHGYSTQAPQGMIGLTVAAFQPIVDDAVAAAKAATP